LTYHSFRVCEQEGVLIDEHPGGDSGGVEPIQKVLDVVPELG